MRKSVVLIEVIFSIMLFSMISIGTMQMIFTLYEKNNTKTFQIHNSIKLESTRLFLIKNNDLTKLKLENKNLFYNDNLLLDNISKYKFTVNGMLSTIDICIYDNKICQKWLLE
jgi:hypothetical protein